VNGATGAGLLFTAAGYAGGWHWYADLFAQFRPQYVVVLGALLPLHLLARQWMTALACVIALGANLAEVLPHAAASPLAPAESEAGPRIRCLSFNVLHRNHEYAAVQQYLRQCGADVLVFQEVSPDWAEAFRGLADVYPHQLPRGRMDSKGAAVLSRLPVRRLDFEEVPGHAPIGAMIAEVEGDTPFTLLGVHSHKPTSAAGALSQHALFTWLAARCRTENARGRPVVLMGDFNSTPWARAFRQFTAQTQLRDTSRGVLFGATWSVRLPQRLLIDHAFVSPEWQVLRREVGPDLGSDHRPLLLDLALPR